MFRTLHISDNRLFDNANALRCENLQLTIQNEKLQVLGSSSAGSSGDCKVHEQRLQTLEQKVLAQQEELTELHRRKGQNAQQIIDLTSKLQDKEKELSSLDTR